MSHVLLLDFGSTYTKASAVSVSEKRLLGTYKTPTTIDTDIVEGMEIASSELKKQTGLQKFDETYACSSAGGGLRIVAIGLVPDLTLTACKMAALNAGGKIICTYSYELTLSDCEEIDALKPDLILFTGGTDGGNKKIVLHNATILASKKHQAIIVIACNRSCRDEVASIVSTSFERVVLTDNVMPRLDRLHIDPARKKIREIFLSDIIQSKGLSSVESLIKDILYPTPAAVIAAVELLSKGTKEMEGLGDLMAIDVGGATTDVYSAADGHPTQIGVMTKGFNEPYMKRTVEGDLGVRYNADSIMEETGIEMFERLSGLSKAEMEKALQVYRQKPSYIASEKQKSMKQLDGILAREATKHASIRHAGQLEKFFTMQGEIYLQTGKDLSQVTTLIGTGGPIIYSDQPNKILEAACYHDEFPHSLRPKKPSFLLDRNYILSTMGVLGAVYPDVAVTILKNSLEGVYL